jgi:ParB family chromosome partitioning protein
VAAKNVLGRGLKALIPEAAGKGGDLRVTLIPIGQIAPNPGQPRKKFSPEALEELTASIRDRGVLQPILVRRSVSGYELIAGERRWRAATQAGLVEIPAIVKEAGREDSLAIALIENVQREDLNPIEAAGAYHTLAEQFGLSQDDVARLVGKDRTSVANYLRLLKLPLAIQEDVSEGRLSMGHARALLALPERHRQVAARDTVIARGLSVRATEDLIRSLTRERASPASQRKASDPNVAAIEDDLRRRLGTKVALTTRGAGGAITISYHSPEELERLLEILLGG